MRDLTVNDYPKKKFPIGKILVLTFGLLLVLIGAVYLLKVDKYVFKGPKTVVALITDTGLKSDKGRTNVLLLGIGGKGHDGPDLTDTLMLASIDKDGKDVVLVSIPRDLWVQELEAKINSAYAYGEEKNNQGLENSQRIISGLLGVPIHYAIRIDFNGFIKAVDLVDGLDLEINSSFIDPKYPINGKEDDLCGLTIETQDKNGTKVQIVKDATGSAIPLTEITDQNDPFVCRYETLTFKKGLTLMDGKTALKFVRSRHGTNGEGSDFARSARQQKVLLAFREKVLSEGTLTKPKTIIDLISTFGASIDTNISDEDIPLFAKLATKVDPQNIRRIVLDATDSPDSKLEFGLPQNYKGQAVIIPKNNDWEGLANYIKGEIYKEAENKN
ncbi:MAG: LCP family protein [Patescibacteria group bacterium]